jgi:CpeS-like protein
MTILDFLQLRAGTWASQRTINNLTIKKIESAKSEIKVEILLENQVLSLCQKCNFDHAVGGISITWDQGSTMLVAIAESPQAGQILCQPVGKAPVIGRYVMGDDILNIITDNHNLHTEEKIWFPRPNVCLRAGITIGEAHVSYFYTEIRKPKN